MNGDPYRIDGPAVISFSGGRTSGYMLKHILDAHGGALPEDIAVVFANTGKERPETLDFVYECGARWNVHITWVEYDWNEPHRTRIVPHNSAARNGEPFEALIDRKGFVPNPRMRFCTSFLKRDRIDSYARYWLGWKSWSSVLGQRGVTRPDVEPLLRLRLQQAVERRRQAPPGQHGGGIVDPAVAPGAGRPPVRHPGGGEGRPAPVHDLGQRLPVRLPLATGTLQLLEARQGVGDQGHGKLAFSAATSARIP